MTQEEKDLLLKDLCARLPYGVRIAKGNVVYPLTGIDSALGYVELALFERILIEDARPYLRPMSSMTEDEKKELEDICTMYNGGNYTDYESFGIEILITHPGYGDSFCQDFTALDWLNAHHFDSRNLIPMGLALEAPEGMYNAKTK